MNRSKLEVSSYIAAIISALIAAYALLPSRLPANGDAQSLPQAIVANPAAPAGTAKGSNQSTPSGTQTSSIGDALAAAKKIYGTTTRNTELERLARLAIARHEYRAAVEAPSLIHGSIRKDELLDLAHCYAVYMGDKSSATEAVGLAYSTATKTTMLLRASKVSALKPGEGSNEPECKAL